MEFPRFLVPFVAVALLLPSSCKKSDDREKKVPFRVNAIIPADGSQNVSIHIVVQVTFSRPVDPTSVVSGTTFTLENVLNPGVPIPGSLTYDPTGRILRFTPTVPLSLAATHTLTLTAGILDNRGNPLDLPASRVPIPTTFDTQSAPDISPPTFAGATGATGISDTEIRVTWDGATDDIDLPSALVYNVYVALAPGAQSFAAPDATTPPGEDSHVLQGLVPLTAYFIVVRAEDTSGNEDANTTEVFASTLSAPDVNPPTFQGVQSATAVSPSEVDLQWWPASDDIATPAQIRYNIYVALSPGGQDFLSPDDVTPPGATTHAVTGLQEGTRYFFVVRAEDPAGNEETNTIEATATTLVSFATQVQPILTASCAFGSCHVGPFPEQGLDLSSYASLVTTAIDVPATQTSTTSGIDLIEPFSAHESYLVHKIDGTHLDLTFPRGTGFPMPVINCCLTPGQRDIIRGWIDQGAQDN